MWGDWVEKAKNAAAQLDQQLNESVGVETPVAKPAMTATGGTETATNVWNDDDFKFDDDDDDEIAPPATPQPVAPAASTEILATPQPKIEAKPTPAVVVAPEAPKPIEDTINNAWSEESQAAFDNFDGVSPEAAAAEEAPLVTPQPESPKKGGLSLQGLASQVHVPSNLQGLASKVHVPSNFQGLASKVHVPSNLQGLASKVHLPAVPNNASDINFMSPFSSLMTSINQDQEQEQQEQPQQQQEDEKAVPETPLKEEAEPSEEEPPKQEELSEMPSQENATEGAWQEEDLDLGDDNVGETETSEPAAANKEARPQEEQVEEEAPKPPAEPSQPVVIKEEKKTEEKTAAAAAATVEVPPKPEEPRKEEVPAETQPLAAETQPPPAEMEPAKESQQSAMISSEKAEKPPPVEAPKEISETATPAAAAPASTGPKVSNEEMENVKKLLSQREEQLTAKAEQMFQLQQMYEKEKQELMKKLSDTKEEAKKRIMKARERCEAAETKAQASTSALTEDAAQQAQLVAALRQEGEKLAHKQAEMEKTVRAARGEARGLQEHLEDETAAKEDALAKIEQLQSELKSTQHQLSSARKGETQAGKLDTELQVAKEDIANKENAIMSLQQSVKELTAENKDLLEEVEVSRVGAAEESLQEKKKLRKEHNAVISDLEAKLQTSEREAALREDQLRHEVEELRKRWQDAVRRADALSMDVQSSTAPLLRQLESMERQQRARASAAAELETKLRAELEETVIRNEKLTKEHSELKTKHGRVERLSKEQQSDLEERRKEIDELTTKAARLEEKLQNLQVEGGKRQEEYEKVERLANEGVSKVRSEMSQAVLESEERYRSQLESMKEELRIEQDKRTQLEAQLDDLLENAAVIVPNPSNEFTIKEAKPAKLVKSEGQAEILGSALKGLGGESDDDDNYTDDEDLEAPPSTGGSFAALQQLTQNLKAAKKELETLRKRLTESEKARESLMEDLGESRDAKEKLPLFEAKVKELMADNREKELDIRGLRDDIAEVKEMYRSQLNALLEEKAAAFAVVAANNLQMNGSRSNPVTEEVEAEPEPELVEDMLGGL